MQLCCISLALQINLSVFCICVFEWMLSILYMCMIVLLYEWYFLLISNIHSLFFAFFLILRTFFYYKLMEQFTYTYILILLFYYNYFFLIFHFVFYLLLLSHVYTTLFLDKQNILTYLLSALLYKIFLVNYVKL